MVYCCEKMKHFLSQTQNAFNSDCIIYYSSRFDEYGIIIHDSGKSYIGIAYCPWCGAKLPASKRNAWFEALEEIGVENPFEDEIPEDFKTDQWWKAK